MNSKIAMFSIIALAAIFTMALPMDSAFAQTSNISLDSEDEYKDNEEHEGKLCPFKDRQGASVNASLNI